MDYGFPPVAGASGGQQGGKLGPIGIRQERLERGRHVAVQVRGVGSEQHHVDGTQPPVDTHSNWSPQARPELRLLIGAAVSGTCPEKAP